MATSVLLRPMASARSRSEVPGRANTGLTCEAPSLSPASSAATHCWAASRSLESPPFCDSPPLSLVCVALIPRPDRVMVPEVHAVRQPGLEREENVQPASMDLVPFLIPNAVM
jgi:hypothetical protein